MKINLALSGAYVALVTCGVSSVPLNGKAYLNYILFDEYYIPVDMGYQRVSEAALFNKERLAFENPIIPTRQGYLFVYLSYESASDNYVFPR